MCPAPFQSVCTHSLFGCSGESSPKEHAPRRDEWDVNEWDRSTGHRGLTLGGSNPPAELRDMQTLCPPTGPWSPREASASCMSQFTTWCYCSPKPANLCLTQAWAVQCWTGFSAGILKNGQEFLWRILFLSPVTFCGFCLSCWWFAAVLSFPLCTAISLWGFTAQHSRRPLLLTVDSPAESLLSGPCRSLITPVYEDPAPFMWHSAGMVHSLHVHVSSFYHLGAKTSFLVPQSQTWPLPQSGGITWSSWELCCSPCWSVITLPAWHGGPQGD